jgi:hypothetical protein
MIFVDDRCDMRRLYIWSYIWSAAYHATRAVQYNIGGGAHRLCGHFDGEAHNTANHQSCGELKQDAVSRNIFRNRREISCFRANGNRYDQWKANRSAELDRTFCCNRGRYIHVLIIITTWRNRNPLK